MDGNIRQLIVYSNTVDEATGVKLVIQAFKSLQQTFVKSKNGDGLDTCGSDLYVQCAEVAFKLKQVKICQECLQMYFNGTPLTNQFLCRAYLCQAKLLSPKNAEDVVEFETAVVYLLKAVNFAKDKARYHFLVYNASVLYWQMARPFLREGHKSILHPTLRQVVAALEKIDDADHDWRIQLTIALIESYVDAGCTKEATLASQSAAQLALSKTPARYKDVIVLQIKHRLADISKLTKDIGSMPQFLAFLKLQKLKSAMQGKLKMDLPSELKKLAAVVCSGGALSTPKPTSREGRGHRGSVQEVILAEDSAASSKAAADKEQQESTVLQMSLQDQQVLEKLIRPQLLVDVARLCVDADQVDLAKTCLSALKECETAESNLMMECELIECEMMVKNLGDQQEAYTRSSVEVRLAAIKRMDQVVQNTMRSGSPSLVQGACASQWNLCLPLLQRNLRHHVRRPLTRVAQALEDISSLLVKLRCQVHTELAKCEESVEQIEAAVKHLDKAMQLDDSGFYHERLHAMLRRLQLSTQLYRAPDRAEDIAAIIIEQARKSANSGSGLMKRSLLVKAGLSLAPDAFQYVLDSENEMKVHDTFNSPREKEACEAKGGMKGITSPVQMLGARAVQWQKCVRKAPGHLKRLGNENDRERVRLWADLTKAARQQQVWDVCRVASMLCLLYDDGRWKMPRKEISESGKERIPGTSKRGDRSASSKSKTPVEEEEPSPETTLHDADLLRTLAEVRFISGEAYIHLLRGEGLKLNDNPTSPTEAIATQKADNKEADKSAWADYCDWIQHLNTEATNAFLRAIELGIELDETWIACSGAVYLWNYNNHLMIDGHYHRLVATFEKVLFGMQQIGHSSEATLLVRICDVIAKGLLTPWIPKKPAEDGTGVVQAAPHSTKDEKRRKKTGNKGGGANAAPVAATLSVDPDSADDLKRALSVCEYGLHVTNGSTPSDVIPAQVRHELLSTWVRVKQMLQQQVAPNFGSEFEKVAKQQSMSKVLVILEMLTLNHNQMMEFVVPDLLEVCDMADNCSWDDPCLELEVWSRLAKLSSSQKNHSLVTRCCKAALGLESAAVLKKDHSAKKPYQHRRKVALEMLAYTSCVLGESFMEISSSHPSARRQAMQSFINSAHYAEQADNLVVVMTACRRWWNSALPLMPTPLERELLRQPLEALLKCVLHSSRNVHGSSAVKSVAGHTPDDKEEEGSVGLMTDPLDDNALRAAMYGLLFQTYADKGQWEEGLAVMDKALHHMPRTKHRLLLFKHRVIVKAKLGKNVHMDIAKFKDESEDYVSHMWHRVALCSRNTVEQLSAFQQAIEALNSEKTRWQKFEYLLELSTWMYSNEFSMQDIVKVVEWACDILFSMKFEHTKIKEEKQDKMKSRRSKVTKSMSRGAPTSQSNHAEVSLKQNKLAVIQTSSQEVNQEEKEPKEDVPVAHERDQVLGIKPSDLSLKLDELESTRQLEGLIRGHVMLATISGEGSRDHLAYCQLAYGFVMRLWKISLASAGVTSKRMPKTDANSDNEGKKSGGKKRIKSTPKPTPAATERPKRKGPPEALPGNVVEWSTYEVPEEILQAFLYDNSECGINKKTITCAGMTVYHLLRLSDYLRGCSLNHLSFPVLCLASVITQIILHSSSWTQLINIRQVIVCYELHLETSAHYWEALFSGNFLPEAEHNASRLDLEMKRIHKELAKQEEARIREAQGEARKGRGDSVPKPKEVDSGSNTLTGRRIGGINRSEIWTEKARLLLGLGYRQDCRVLLSEALTVADDNEDIELKAEIYHGLAALAIQEANTGQAMQLVRRAQLISGDEAFWKDNIHLLIDAITRNQDPSLDDIQKVLTVIRVSLDCLNKLQEQRPTKTATIGHMRAMLGARACFLKLSLPNCNASDQLTNLQLFEETLQELGFIRDLASMHLEHSDVLLKLSKADNEKRISHLFSAIYLLRKSTENLTSICNSVLPQEGDKDISLPAHRELMEVQLRLVSLMLHAAVISAEGDRIAKKEEEAKGEIQRKVEIFVGKKEEGADEVSRRWDAERTTFLHQSFTILSTLHNSLPKQHTLRAIWLHLIGRCLRLLAENFYPAPPINQWEISKFVDDHVLRGESVDISLKEPDVEPSSESEEVDSPVKVDPLTPEGAQVLRNSELGHRLLMQATEVLAQSINMALQLQDWSVVSEAALDMVECTAQCDATTASTHLALYQSAKTSMTLKSLLMKSLPDPDISQLATLLHQEEWLMRGYVSTGLHASTLRKDVLKTLEDKYMAWRRLKLAPNYHMLLKELPPSFNTVILQHCPEQGSLYCAVLDKAKQQPAHAEGKGKGKDKAATSPAPSRAFIARVQVNNDLFKKIEDVGADFQQRLMSFLLQSEYQVFQLGMRKKMLQQLSKSPAEAVISDTTLEEQALEEMKLKEEFNEILTGMESYLSSVTQHISEKLVKQIADQAEAMYENGLPPTNPDHVIILADPSLMHLPLEALCCFRSCHVSSVCRDFSLQMLHRRWIPDADDVAVDKKGERKPGSKTPKGGRESAKKGAAPPAGKTPQANRDSPNGCRVIDTHGVHFIVDPHNDCSETEEHRPDQTFKHTMQMYPHFTSRWTGCYGPDALPSVGQWEGISRGCTAFIYYGMERFIAQFPPSKLSSFDLERCEMFLLLDKAQTHHSFRHQSKIDVDKTNNLLSIEKPLETAMLLSLRGANCVCLNQWHSASEDNATKLRSFLGSLMEDGKASGEAIRKLIFPHLTIKPPVVDRPSTAAKGKDKSKQKHSARSRDVTPEKRDGRRSTSRNRSADHSISHSRPTSACSHKDEKPDVTEEKSPDASLCNMVLFGLPNLTIA